MQYALDTADAEENTGKFVLVPEGTYAVQIIEKSDKMTSNGDPMVNIKLAILDGEFKDKFLFDNIVIPMPGGMAFKIMGRTMHFLHVIGQPHKGKFSTDSDKWLWQKLKVKVKHKLQEKGKYAGDLQATVASHDFFETPKEENGKIFDDTDVPF